MKWPLDVTPAPSMLVLPPGAVSLEEADEAIDLWEFYSGKTLDEAQRLTVYVMMAQKDNFRWAARTTGREMARQNGKGDEIEVPEFWDLTQVPGSATMHTAHELRTVASAHERMVALLEGHKDLRRKIGQVLNGIGQQKITMTNDSLIAYATRTNGGGRGLDDISRLVVDEAQHAKREQLASATPILMANANPQTNLIGTGGIEEVSEWWWELRERTLADDPGDFGYVGHTAAPISRDREGRIVAADFDVQNRQTWVDNNPGLHAGRAEIEFFEEQLKNLGPHLFAREHLCVWDERPGEKVAAFNLKRWASITDANSIELPETTRLALEVHDQYATFGIAGKRGDGLGHLAVRDHVPVDRLVVRAKELCDGHGCPLTVVKGSAAEAHVTNLEEAGVPVDLVTAVDYAKACTLLITSIEGEALFRHRGDTRITQAIAAAKVKETEGGLKSFSRKSTDADISFLTAVTVAWARVGVTVEEPPKTAGLSVVFG